jgi:hypothetical protein
MVGACETGRGRYVLGDPKLDGEEWAGGGWGKVGQQQRGPGGRREKQAGSRKSTVRQTGGRSGEKVAQEICLEY